MAMITFPLIIRMPVWRWYRQLETQHTTTEIKQTLINLDYQEVINYSFVDAGWEADLVDNHKPITLLNPISNQMNVMRSTLIGGLIANLQFNLNRKQVRVRLFEVGCCFLRENVSDCKQIEKISGLSYGDFSSEQWGIAARNVDFYDVKADVEVLCRGKSVEFKRFSHPALHPGKSAEIYFEDRIIGWIGELHPRWQTKYSLQKKYDIV